MKVKAFIARDKDGELFIYFFDKPHKWKGKWLVYNRKYLSLTRVLGKNLFPSVKWKDEEPTEVTIEIVGEKAQQPQEQLNPQTKFDPKNLNPFDRILVRSFKTSKWRCEHFSYFNEGQSHPYMGSTPYAFCVPYNDDTKHLVGTSKDAPEYYRYWED